MTSAVTSARSLIVCVCAVCVVVLLFVCACKQANRTSCLIGKVISCNIFHAFDKRSSIVVLQTKQIIF